MSRLSGVYALFGIEFTLQTVAAFSLLYYSINDTVIVYDRVRENQEMYPGNDLKLILTMPLTKHCPGHFNFRCDLLKQFGHVILRWVAFKIFPGRQYRYCSGSYSTLCGNPITLILDRWNDRRLATQMLVLPNKFHCCFSILLGISMPGTDFVRSGSNSVSNEREEFLRKFAMIPRPSKLPLQPLM